MKRFLVGLVVGALCAMGVSAIAAKRPTPKFGVARVQGVEPNVAVESGISDPRKVGFDVIAPPNEMLHLAWTLTCLIDGETVINEGTFDEPSERFGEVSVAFNQDFYGDASTCSLDVDAASEGSGKLNVKLRGAGEVPVEAIPEPEPEPSPEPSESPTEPAP